MTIYEFFYKPFVAVYLFVLIFLTTYTALVYIKSRHICINCLRRDISTLIVWPLFINEYMELVFGATFNNDEDDDDLFGETKNRQTT